MLTSRVFHGRFFHSPLATLILSNEKRESVLSLTHSLTVVLFALDVLFFYGTPTRNFLILFFRFSFAHIKSTLEEIFPFAARALRVSSPGRVGRRRSGLH